MTSLPPRSEWEQRTAASYDAVAQFMVDHDHPLIPDDSIFQVRALMGDNPKMLDLGCGPGRAIPVLRGSA